MIKKPFRPEDFSPLDLALADLLPSVFDYRDAKTLVGQKYRIGGELLPAALRHLEQRGLIELTNEKRKRFRKLGINI